MWSALKTARAWLLQRLVLLAVACLGLARAVAAQGGPPLETDDPGTPGPGHVELNLSTQGEWETGGTGYDAPRIDINVGVGSRMQAKLEVPWQVATVPDQPTESGVGNVGIGFKWRFEEQGPLTISTYPQLDLPRSAGAGEKGIAESEASLLLPIEIAYSTGPAAFNAEVGYEHSASADGIVYGLAVAHDPAPWLELLGECHGSGDTDFTHQGLLCGLGFRWKLVEAASLMGAYSAAVAGSAEDRPDHRAYGGVQLRW